MIYLSAFTFPDEDAEWAFRMSVQRTCYETLYPFYVLPKTGLRHLVFAPITILCGGNGSGKSTALNVIAEKLRLKREAPYNRSNFFGDYVDLCEASLEEAVPGESRIVTSDDVFDFMLSIRALNEGIDRKKEALLEEYASLKGDVSRLRSMDDYDALKKRNSARKKTQSAFVRDNIGPNVREQSNGESADAYFKSRLADDTLCLLDEPENSLSPKRQRELAAYLEESARYCGNQLVISTHSPFLLAMRGAKIYDLDKGAAVVQSWTALENVRVYRDFFEENRARFDGDD